MPRVAYSKEQREQMRNRLLSAGLERFVQYGYKGAKLADILKEVGISKPFFYTFFSSKEDFVVAVLLYQHERFLEEVCRQASRRPGEQEELLREMIHQRVFGTAGGRCFLSASEQSEVVSHLGQENYRQFQRTRTVFFQRLLEAVGVRATPYVARVAGNMIMTAAVVGLTDEQNLPLLFAGEIRPTLELAEGMICRYLLPYMK